MAKKPSIAELPVWHQLATSTEDTGVQAFKEAKLIDFENIRPNPNQPRKTFYPESLHELAESIREHGLLQPIIVRPEGDEFLIIAGHRRYEACKIIGLKQVACIVREANDLETLEQALIENIQREDINPVEEARCYQILKEEYNYSIRDLANKIQKSVGYIHSRLELLEHDDLAARVSQGEIGVFEARELAKIKDEAKRQELTEQVAANQLDREALKREVKQRTDKAEQLPLFDPNTYARRWDKLRRDIEKDINIDTLAAEEKEKARQFLVEMKQTIEQMLIKLSSD